MAEVRRPEPEAPREVWIGGQRLRVEVRPGTGVPLLLCNGIGASLDLLDPFVEALDADIPVVRFDVPGVGASPTPRQPYNFFLLARLVAKLMDRLGYDQFNVLGISWGGGLAQQIAFQMPRRCRQLVLVSTATGALIVPAKPQVLSKMITPRRYRDPDYAATIAAEIYGGKMRERPGAVRHVMNSHSNAGSRSGYLLQLLAAAGWASLPMLPLIRQPTLILSGTDDPIIPVANARLMHRAIPHSQLHLFDDGHLGLITSASDLAPVVAGFLGSQAHAG